MERVIRLPICELEDLLENADLIDGGEAVSRVWIEPGELVIELVQ